MNRLYLKTLAVAARYSFLAGRLALSCTTDDGPTVLVFASKQIQHAEETDGG